MSQARPRQGVSIEPFPAPKGKTPPPVRNVHEKGTTFRSWLRYLYEAGTEVLAWVNTWYEIDMKRMKTREQNMLNKTVEVSMRILGRLYLAQNTQPVDPPTPISRSTDACYKDFAEN